MKKVLILYTSVGQGHKSMAENIGWQLEQAGLEVRLADIGKVQEGLFPKIVIPIHQFINRRLPWLWSWLYFYGHFIILPFRVFIAGFNYQKAKSLVDEFQPDLIIGVQTTASAVVAYLKQKGLYTKLFSIAFCDFHLHRYWLYKQADFYLANIEEQKKEMMELGILAEKIYVCGMTLKTKMGVDAGAIRKQLNIGPKEKVVLMASGSLGTLFNEDVINKMSQLSKARIIIACGKNQEYKKYLEEKYGGKNFIILGFYQPFQELYAIADVFLSKPGGLSTSEALQYNLPMIITHVLPGQEELNLKYLLNKGLVMAASTDIVAQVKKELAYGDFRKALENNQNLQALLNPKMNVAEVVKSMLHTV